MPSGGVSLDNVSEGTQAGCFAVGVCGKLTGAAKDGDHDTVTRTAREFERRIAGARA